MPPPVTSILILLTQQKEEIMLTIQRPNAKKTGAVLEVLPSGGCSIGIKLYPQMEGVRLAYDEPISTTLIYEDMALILMVLQGREESILNGKGLYHQYVHHAVRILFRHVIEPVAGYELEIIDGKNDGSECRRAKIMLQTQDALALSYGIQGVLSNSLIGDQ